jgi:hypothetical protein
MMMKFTVSLSFAFVSFSQVVGAQTHCEYQLKELRQYALAAKYEQLPAAQKPHFMAQLSPAEQLGLMGLQSGHNLGAGTAAMLGGGKASTLTDQFNLKTEEFKRSCGFMLK